jgi:hypothetical protein
MPLPAAAAALSPQLIGGIVGGASNLFGALGNIFGSKKSNAGLASIQIPEYQVNPLADQRLGMAQTMMNSFAPGVQQAQQGVQQATANQISNAQRGATDAAQFLATGGNISGQANKAFTDIMTKDAEDAQRRYANLSQAQEGVINEGDKVFQSKMNKLQMQTQIQGAMAQNRQNAMQGLVNAGTGIGNIFASMGKTT